MPDQPIRIALVNDYQIVVAGLSALLRPYSARVNVVELDANELPTEPVDIAIYDTFAAVGGNSRGLEKAVASEQANRVAVYSFSEDPRAIEEAFRLGADGYISKAIAPARLVTALERIAGGDRVVEVAGKPAPSRPPQTPHVTSLAFPGQSFGLTPREAEILGLIAKGLSNDEIAAVCYLSINTVKSYIRSAYRKASVSTRAQAVGWALRNGFDPDPLQVD